MNKCDVTTVAMSVQFECDVVLKQSGDFPNDAFVFTIEDSDPEFPNEKDADYLVFPGDDERHNAIRIYIEKNIDTFHPEFLQNNLRSGDFLSVDAICEIKALRNATNLLMTVIDIDKMIKVIDDNSYRMAIDDDPVHMNIGYADCFGTMDAKEIVICIGGGKKMYVYRI